MKEDRDPQRLAGLSGGNLRVAALAWGRGAAQAGPHDGRLWLRSLSRRGRNAYAGHTRATDPKPLSARGWVRFV